MTGDMGRRRSMAGSTSGGASSQMVGRRSISSCRVCGEGSGPGLTDADLASCPGARRFDRLPRTIVVRVVPLKEREEPLGLVGGPKRPSAVFVGRGVLPVAR